MIWNIFKFGFTLFMFWAAWTFLTAVGDAINAGYTLQ